MGKVILRKNGVETQYINGEDFTTLTPQSGVYSVGVDFATGYFEKLNPDGSIINLEQDITGSTNTKTVTYTELVNYITGGTLESGSFYLITDFQTCYDQPDFDYDMNPITTGNYKQGPVEPILVLATSANTISEIAYQPAYPKDRILYDWTFNTTEVTGGVAFGRITERIDEFNNRTDYDHRNILFKRYRLYTYRQEQPLNGFVELQNDGTVIGTNTSFTGLTIGDVVYMAGLFYEITGISGNTTMSVSGDTISSFGCCSTFYKAIEETNGSGGYFSYKQMNVKSSDFVEYTTFGDAINQNYAINNYIGDYANYYQNINNGAFILSNNVFLEGGYQTNKFGDYCYNNTFGTDNSNNIWGDWCYENVSTNDIDDNVIGHGFHGNLINTNFTDNHIGNDFTDNKLLAENEDDFEDNIIGNGFNDNIIYSRFYKNEILDNFNENTIGDFGNLDNFEFYRNYIRNGFNNNTIRQDFQNNQIGTNFQNNTTNGEFIGNTILNGFNNNTIGSDFGTNNIGNAFNNNIIYDSFYRNTTDYGFNNNLISNDFNTNQIGNYFENNRPSNSNLFGWNDLNNISTRTYDNFRDVVGGGNLGNRLLGKELVMRVISTSQYFRIKFTQWTQDGNGGGFQYERQELDSGGGSIGSFVTFTKTNYGSEVDIIIPGVLEITRGNNGGIYNVVTESSWNSSVSPDDTEWNSIYTQPNNGERFAYNKIGNNFYNNIIGSDFGYGGGDPYGNVILDDFRNNTIGQYAYNNVIGNRFTDNTIGDNFENNTIKNYFELNNIGEVFESNVIGDYFQQNSIGDNFRGNNIQNSFVGNTILDGFESNEIGNGFGNNGSGPGSPLQNVIFNDFKYNKIGNFFGNDYNYPSVGGGTLGDGGNIINSGFQFNVIGDNFIFNALDLNFTNNKIGNDFWFNSFDPNTSDNVIGNLFVGNSGLGGIFTPIGSGFISNTIGNYAAFNLIDTNFQFNKIGNFFGNASFGNQNQIADGFRNNNIGDYFGDDGSQTSGGNIINYEFYDNLIGNKFYGNTIDAEFFRNDIGNEFFNNSLNGGSGNVFHNNEIGNRFNNNNTAGFFVGNIIGGGFNNNNIGDSFYTNEIGFGFNNNSVGDSFTNNFIGYYFNSNTIGNQFFENKVVASNFGSNTIGNDFRYNIVDLGVSSVDFTSGPATHVYGAYNCTIFSRQDGTARLSYYDNSDVLNITNIDA